MPETASPAPASTSLEAEITAALGRRSIVLVGMMGAGKSTIGRRLSARLRLPFLDADTEIEAAAGMSIPDIFENHGEPHFRDGEARVIARLLDSGPGVMATGGGAFLREETRRPHPQPGGFDLAQGRCRHHHAPGQAPCRPSAAADRRPDRDGRAAAWRTRAVLPPRRPDDLVARRTTRKNRRRVHRCPAGLVVRRWRRRGANTTPGTLDAAR